MRGSPLDVRLTSEPVVGTHLSPGVVSQRTPLAFRLMEMPMTGIATGLTSSDAQMSMAFVGGQPAGRGRGRRARPTRCTRRAQGVRRATLVDPVGTGADDGRTEPR